MRGSPEAHALHAEFPAIDLHADTLLWARWLNYDLQKRHEPPLPLAALAGHVDVPRMQEGGMGAQFFGLVSFPWWMGKSPGLAADVHEQIDELERAAQKNGTALKIVRSADEIEACNQSGAVAALLGIEGAHALEGRLEELERFAARGVRYLGILHFNSNQAGYPAFGRGRNDEAGLTAFGHSLIEKCEEQRVIVDLAHINKKGFLEACARATKPPVVSHTGVLGAFEHWRNIDDDQLRAVADKGGCIGVIFCPQYLGGDGLAPVVKHMRHIVNTVGIEAVALGSDWDGFIVPTKQLADPRGLPELSDALLADGFTPQDVGKLLRGNVMRVLRDNPVAKP